MQRTVTAILRLTFDSSQRWVDLNGPFHLHKILDNKTFVQIEHQIKFQTTIVKRVESTMARVAAPHWSKGLLIDLSFPSKWILHSDNVVVIVDKYPKAKFHYLVLPRENIPSIFDVSG